MSLEYSNIDTNDAADNSSGTKNKVYFVPMRDVDTFGDIDDTSVVLGATGLVATAHTLVALKAFTTLEVTLKENSVKNEFGSESGSGMWKNSARIFVDGTIARGLANQLVRDKTLWLIPLNDNTIAQIGDKDHPALVKAMFDSKSDDSTDPRGYEFEIYSHSTNALYYDPSLAIDTDTAT